MAAPRGPRAGRGALAAGARGARRPLSAAALVAAALAAALCGGAPEALRGGSPSARRRPEGRRAAARRLGAARLAAALRGGAAEAFCGHAPAAPAAPRCPGGRGAVGRRAGVAPTTVRELRPRQPGEGYGLQDDDDDEQLGGPGVLPLFSDGLQPPERRRKGSLGASSKKQRPVELKLRRRLAHEWNPLLQEVDGLPNFRDARPLHLSDTMFAATEQFRRDVDVWQSDLREANALSSSLLTWAKFARPLERLLDRLGRAWSTISLIREVNSSRDAHHVFHDRLAPVNGLSMALAQSEELYESMRLLSERRLSEAQRRVLRRLMGDMRHAGVGLRSAEAARRHDDIQHELAHLAAIFQDNVARDEARGIRLLTEVREVADFPAAAREQAASAARSAGHGAATAERGPWLLTLAPAVRKAVLERSGDEDLRRQVFLAHAHRGWRNITAAVGLEPAAGDNSWIVARMLQLRRDWARLFEYDSFADLVFTARMASLPQAQQLLGGLRAAAQAAAAEEARDLQAFAEQSGAAGELRPWDVPFWRDRLFQESLTVRMEDLQPYFPLSAVLQGAFQLLFRLFSVKVYAAPDAVPVWRDGVRFFYVVDDEAPVTVPIAGFYLDMACPPRPGEPDFTAEVSLSYSRALGKGKTPRRPVVHLLGRLAGSQDSAAEFNVVIDKTAGQALGVEIDSLDGTSLLITAVTTGGLIQQWNDDHPELALKPGDRIVEVNGIRDDVNSIFEECSEDRILELLVVRRAQAAGPLSAPEALDAAEPSARPLLPEVEPLLAFDQVRGLFRAMGAAVRELLTDQGEGLAAGSKGMELDMVNFLPEFLELWAYEPGTLRSMGRHARTGAPLPEPLLAAAVTSRSFGAGIPLLEDVRLAQLDLDLHARFDPGRGGDVWQQVAGGSQENLSHLPVFAGESLLNGMTEEFATGYAAGRYAGLWARVLAADAFAAFEERGLGDARAVRELGLRLRREVVAPGGGREPLDAYRAFRGRRPRAASLLRLLGLAPPAGGQAARPREGDGPAADRG